MRKGPLQASQVTFNTYPSVTIPADVFKTDGVDIQLVELNYYINQIYGAITTKLGYC